MSTVAWDGTYLVGDCQATWGGVPVKTRKVMMVPFKRTNYLIGWVGSESQGIKFVEHFTKSGLDGRPELSDGTEVMVICRNWARVESGRDTSDVMNERLWAIGSGSGYALGALHHGATAEEAVQIATTLDVYTGMGIEKIRFNHVKE